MTGGSNGHCIARKETATNKTAAAAKAPATLTTDSRSGLHGSLSFVIAVCITPSFRTDVRSRIDQYLRGLGFTLFDISPVRLKRKKYERVYSKGQVFWTDALYFKDLPGLEGDINFSVEKAVKTIAISELYGYPDFALELLDLYNSKKIINRKVYNEIKKILVRKTMKNILSLEYQLLTIIQPFIKLYLEEKKSSARNFYKLIKRKK